jgi:aspartate kinase
MATVVQKYGGTSVADPQRISRVADRVQLTREQGNDVVVVVSAMGKTTDQLLDLARQITDTPSPRELDMLLTAGERITMALLAMALEKRSIPAVSYTGSQAGILTDSSHGEARIREITGERVKDSLGGGKVVIVAGFQGVDPDSREVTTLGRGGSDTTAVALAATLGAEICEILTDVDGVFTADPRVVPGAKLVKEISFDDMIALARNGATVLVDHSVEYAKTHSVPIHVRSSFTSDAGTLVGTVDSATSVIGIARKSAGDRGSVTLVGGSGSELVDLARHALEEAEIDADLHETTPNTVTFWIDAELQDNAMRRLHESLGLSTYAKEERNG